MATSVAFGEDLEIPFVGSLSEFRQWALSEDFPERGRIEVDLAPRDYYSHGAFDSGRVSLTAKATGQADRYVEVVGTPDLVVEIVSDHSVKKDTVRLFEAYWKAGVAEYWLMDARGDELVFCINRRGVAGFEPVPSDAGGFQQSAVFQQWFRLTRRRDRRGGWAFDLERKGG